MYEYTELDDLQSMLSDFHKEVYGFRPRYMSTAQWNDIEWLKAEIESVRAASVGIFAEEARREREAVESFETQVTALCASLRKDRETIVRWMFDGSNSNGDWDYYCFNLGIPYGYFKEYMLKDIEARKG